MKEYKKLLNLSDKIKVRDVNNKWTVKWAKTEYLRGVNDQDFHSFIYLALDDDNEQLQFYVGQDGTKISEVLNMSYEEFNRAISTGIQQFPIGFSGDFMVGDKSCSLYVNLFGAANEMSIGVYGRQSEYTGEEHIVRTPEIIMINEHIEKFLAVKAGAYVPIEWKDLT